jgi:hypothetical protein
MCTLWLALPDSLAKRATVPVPGRREGHPESASTSPADRGSMPEIRLPERMHGGHGGEAGITD